MASPPTPDFADLIARLAVELEAKQIPFMLIGGQAVLLHGEPRLTQDVDVTMGVGPDGSRTSLEFAVSSGRWRAGSSRHSTAVARRAIETAATPAP